MLLALLASGCGDGAPAAEDGGPGADAGIADGAVQIGDAGARDASTSLDGSAADAGPLPTLCLGACDPSGVPDPDAGAGSCGDGMTCAVRGSAAMCVSEVGTVPAGERCDADNLCAPGLACFPGSGGSVCARVCCPGDDSLCEASQRCGGDGVLASGTLSSWGRCVERRACDVLRPLDVCSPREGCYVLGPRGETGCLLAGEGDVGEPCDLAARNACAPGLVCAGVPGGTCRRICALGDPTTCPRDEGRCVKQAYSPDGTGVCVGP